MTSVIPDGFAVAPALEVVLAHLSPADALLALAALLILAAVVYATRQRTPIGGA